MRQLKITQSPTNKSPVLDKYLSDVSAQKMITAEREAQLAQRIREGDDKALDELVRANLRFVISVAKQYQNNGLTLSDLISEGNVGLIKAAKKFDERRGFKFISYAVWWIRQSIIQALGEQSRVVRLPMNKISAIRELKKARMLLEQQHGREPTSGELAEKLETTELSIDQMAGYYEYPVSLDAPLNEESDISWQDIYIDQNQTKTDDLVMHQSLEIEVQRMLNKLSGREQEVMRLYFGIGLEQRKTLDEIAQVFELTRERVRQIKEHAIRRLQSETKKQLLQPYM